MAYGAIIFVPSHGKIPATYATKLRTTSGCVGGAELREYMAGVAGFEPANAGIKTRCLAAWRHPNKLVDSVEQCLMNRGLVDTPRDPGAPLLG